MDNFSIVKLTTQSSVTTLSVYEIDQVAAPSIIYFSVPGIPDIGNCKANKSNFDLQEPVLSLNLQVPTVTYAFRTNDMTDAHRIYVHYGRLRAGSYDFDAIDCLASTDTSWLYQYNFTCIDIPKLLADNPSIFDNYKLQQQLSFTVASYDIEGRRLDISAQNSFSNYDKLTVSLNLHLNELTVQCLDTARQSVCTHLSKLSGIAEESIQCAAEVLLQTYASDTTVLNRYQVLAANPDYSDDSLKVALPSVSRESVAGDIHVKYIVDIGTTGEVITVVSRMILTDEQLANLMLKFGIGTSLDISDLLAIIERQQAELRTYLTIVY